MDATDTPGLAPEAPAPDRLLEELARDGQRRNPTAVAAMWEARQEGIAARAENPQDPTLGPKKVSYTHDAMIDQLIANPMITQRQLAAHFGYTESWVSLVMASDAFKARLEMRREELIDPTIRATIEERFRALAAKSLEVLQKKLEAPNVSDNLAVQAATLAARSLGLGQGSQAPPPVAPDRLERLGGRLLALLGNRAVASLDQNLVMDVPSRQVEPVPAPGVEL